jgi:hypothetical protein
VPPLCCKVTLDVVRPLKTKNAEHLEKVREFLMESECTFKKSHGNTVNVYRDKEHLNTALIYEGFLKADLSKITNNTEKTKMK